MTTRTSTLAVFTLSAADGGPSPEWVKEKRKLFRKKRG